MTEGCEIAAIDIEIKEIILTLKGERKQNNEVKEQNYYRQERRSGKFYRSFTLPAVIDTEKVMASHKAGVLEVKIPKPREQDSTQIEIKLLIFGPGNLSVKVVPDQREPLFLNDTALGLWMSAARNCRLIREL